MPLRSDKHYEIIFSTNGIHSKITQEKSSLFNNFSLFPKQSISSMFWNQKYKMEKIFKINCSQTQYFCPLGHMWQFWRHGCHTGRVAASVKGKRAEMLKNNAQCTGYSLQQRYLATNTNKYENEKRQTF